MLKSKIHGASKTRQVFYMEELRKSQPSFNASPWNFHSPSRIWWVEKNLSASEGQVTVKAWLAAQNLRFWALSYATS